MTDVYVDRSDHSPNDSSSDVIAEKLGFYTAIGLDLASQSVELLTETIQRATVELEKNIRHYGRMDYKDKDKGVMRTLLRQLEAIKGSYEHLPVRLEEDILTLPDRTFTIILFGRTEAGKSTLMNVLTHGDGTQIGEWGTKDNA